MQLEALEVVELLEEFEEVEEALKVGKKVKREFSLKKVSFQKFSFQAIFPLRFFSFSLDFCLFLNSLPKCL